jgi:type II secretory pathway pseudopilin PulG
MKKILKNKKGITLVALVVTIVILLILAGISISTLTNTGIFEKAKDAREKSEVAEKQQSETLDSYEKELNKYTSDNLEENIGVKFEKNTELHDKNGAKIIVPAGFKVANTDDLTVEKGIVIEDSKGNQYVWIPCTTEDSKSQLQFKRTEWWVEDDGGAKASKDELTLTCPENYSDNGLTYAVVNEIVAQIKAEKYSVRRNGGYYIGRYEVGDENGTAVIKADKTPMANIIWSTAYSKAKGIGGGPGATTYLCSSYAWDTAINFIQNNGFLNYAKAREDSYNENWVDKNVKDLKGNIIKAANKAELLPTGKTTPKSNIYDMGGNVSEFTTEVMPSTSEPVVLRGGIYGDIGPAGQRYDIGTSGAGSGGGFRATLFLK